MRLTMVNFIVRRRPHGYQYRGKYRVVKEVEVPALMKRYTEYELQEQNMLFLRHPYLTVEQSKGHMTELKKTKDPLAYRASSELKKKEKFERHYTWAEQLSHLRVKDAWD